MTTFRVWAPAAASVDVVIGAERRPLTAGAGGWWSADVPGAGPGTDYAFSLDGGESRPDPRSPWQPHGVHGPSRLIDHAAFDWHDAGWRPPPLAAAVIYELHVGTFTPGGTFASAARSAVPSRARRAVRTRSSQATRRRARSIRARWSSVSTPSPANTSSS